MPKYTNRQQLLSTRTVARIAEEVHNEETPKLIKRQYLFGKYDAAANRWDQLVPTDPNGDIVDFETTDKLVCISTLRIMDNATTANVGIANDPETMRNEQQQAAEDGVNVIAPVTSLQEGKRLSDQILVHAVGATLRLRVVRVNPSIYTDKVTFRFGFYLWTKIDANGYLDAAAIPDIKTLVKWQPIGYSAQLDSLQVPANVQGIPYARENLNMLLNSEKVKTLVEKTVTVNISSITGSVNCRMIDLYKEFKDPIKIIYSPRDQTGQTHLNQKIFFAIRSNLPNLETLDIEPRAMAMTKMYYTNFT